MVYKYISKTRYRQGEAHTKAHLTGEHIATMAENGYNVTLSVGRLRDQRPDVGAAVVARPHPYWWNIHVSMLSMSFRPNHVFVWLLFSRRKIGVPLVKSALTWEDPRLSLPDLSLAIASAICGIISWAANKRDPNPHKNSLRRKRGCSSRMEFPYA